MDWQTSTRLLGLPLIHVATGRPVDGSYRRGVAKGWIAIGDIALGVLFSAGGIAVGGISVGGLSVGILTLGGLAAGFAAVGGLSIGVLAVGGAAFGWSAALGGLAIARDVASGGVAFAIHANDAAATDYFAVHPFFVAASWAMKYSLALVFLPAIIAFFARMRSRRKARHKAGNGGD